MELLYHVTLTRYRPSIQQSGIVAGIRPRNWWTRKGTPLGGDAVYAFTLVDDAIAWAHRQEWAALEGKRQRQPYCTIVEFTAEGLTLLPDDHPEAGLARGRWVKLCGPVPPCNLRRAFCVRRSHYRQLARRPLPSAAGAVA